LSKLIIFYVAHLCRTVIAAALCNC